MREIVVVSGKGGTGKTSVTATLGYLASRDGAVLCDADVDAPDLWLLVPPREREEIAFMGMDGAHIDHSKCTGCGKCMEFCRFEGIEMTNGVAGVIDAHCEGCGGCMMVCPEGAVSMIPRQQGRWFRAKTDMGPLIFARLFPGGENSGMLVTTVKRAAREAAKKEGVQTVIVDGPPGIACPAIAALTGASLALAVTEPTESGLHDLRRLHQVSRKLDVPMAVILNKSDLTDMAPRIKTACQEMGIPLLGEIPFSRAIPAAIASATIPLKEMTPAIQEIWIKTWEMSKGGL